MSDEMNRLKSAELVARGSQKRGLTPQCDAIHDLESILWVLVWLCITRGAPNTRREELTRDPQTAEERLLHKALHTLFEDRMDNLANVKLLVLTNESESTRLILKHITPFCEPLRRLIRKFRALLIQEYKKEDFEGIHGRFIGLLERHCSLVPRFYDLNPTLSASFA